MNAVNEKQYTYGDGAHAFVLKQELNYERSYDATLQFGEGDEIWVLEKSQGVRGDVIYRNDTGRIFLRVNHFGGATLYPTPSSMGIPVLQTSAFKYEAHQPTISDTSEPLTSIEDWSRAYAYAGNKKTKNTKKEKPVTNPKNIVFADWPHSKTAYKAELISHLSGLIDNHKSQTLKKIVVKIGEQPSTVHENSDLTIWVNPALGHAGRPSTEKILSHLSENGG